MLKRKKNRSRLSVSSRAELGQGEETGPYTNTFATTNLLSIALDHSTLTSIELVQVNYLRNQLN